MLHFASVLIRVTSYVPVSSSKECLTFAYQGPPRVDVNVYHVGRLQGCASNLSRGLSSKDTLDYIS